MSAPTRSWPIICTACGLRAARLSGGRCEFRLSRETRRAHARSLRQRTREEERSAGAGPAPSAPPRARRPQKFQRTSRLNSAETSRTGASSVLRCGSPAAVACRTAPACAQSPSQLAGRRPRKPRRGPSPLPPLLGRHEERRGRAPGVRAAGSCGAASCALSSRRSAGLPGDADAHGARRADGGGPCAARPLRGLQGTLRSCAARAGAPKPRASARVRTRQRGLVAVSLGAAHTSALRSAGAQCV